MKQSEDKKCFNIDAYPKDSECPGPRKKYNSKLKDKAN